MIGKICGTGAYIPEKTVTNFDLAKFVDTNDEWIRGRTGVCRRHIAENETTSVMAAKAGRMALDNAKTATEEVDMILVATMSPDIVCPAVACEVQRLLGADRAVCYDMNGACTGFLFAFQAAQAYIQSNMYRTILVIGAETVSNLINWQDRSTCILFGDGAGAVVVKVWENNAEQQKHCFEAAAHSNGKKRDALLCRGFPQMTWQQKNASHTRPYIQMDGQAVFKFAVRQVPEVIREVLKKAETDSGAVNYFVLHQANRRIVEAVAKRLEEPLDKFPMNLQEYGNTSSASIPILLNEMNQKGMLRRGDKIVIAGFGAGLSWGAVFLEW